MGASRLSLASERASIRTDDAILLSSGRPFAFAPHHISHYAAITQLSVRQAFATFEITVPYNKTTRKYDTNDTLLFLKEISSNGDMSTVDGMLLCSVYLPFFFPFRSFLWAMLGGLFYRALTHFSFPGWQSSSRSSLSCRTRIRTFCAT